MSSLKKLIREVHRRSLWQVLGIYIGASWAILTVVDTMAGALSLPGWAASLALFLLVIGLPVVLATAFVQEGMTTRESAAPAQPLDEVGEVPPVSAPEPTGRHRLLTWGNALLGGVGALALLGLLSAGWLATRALGVGPAATLIARGVLDERAIVVLADFDSGDPGLARAATEAFRVDFAQSAVVTVLEPAQVARVLERMRRPRDAALDVELATEVAVREGIGAVIAGEINGVGSSYLVSARIVWAEDGTELVSHRETASSEDEIIDALDEVSKRLRERIGESLRKLGADEALDRVTTPSLDALRKYSQALQAIETAGDMDRGIALLEEAVALDSGFAMAYRKLGTQLGNLGQQRARSREALTRAFERSDRLTERERYLAAAMYYLRVAGDNDRAITAYRNLLELNPNDSWANNNLGVVLSNIKDYEQADEYYLRAIASDSAANLPYTNAIHTHLVLGKRDEARTLLDLFESKFPGHLDVAETRANFASSQGDYDTAEDYTRSQRERTAGSQFWRSRTSIRLARIDATQGRFLAAQVHMRDAMDADLERGLPAVFIMRSVNLGALWLFVMQRPDRALQTIDAALAQYPLDSLDPLDIPYTWIAKLYADAGRPDRARELLDEFDRVFDPALQSWDDGIVSDFARVAIAMAEGRADEAVELNRRGSYRGGVIAWDPQLGRAFEQAGRPDSAIVTYERYLETGSISRLRTWDCNHRGAILERLGVLHDDRDDLENAARYYAMFVELWSEADEELQPRVRQSQARLEEILAERG